MGAIFGNEMTWLRGLVQKYYSSVTIAPAYDVSRREFGYGSIQKIDTRHAGFATNAELNAFLRNVSPLFISASVSQFLNPEARPNPTKGLVGSDLIYEFDADDIPTDCKQIHDSWACPHCGAQGKGRVLKCTSCAHGTKVDEWVCSECVNATKTQTFSLLSVLRDDIGFSDDAISVNFSGSKGYHTHIRSTAVFSLPKSARVELMDYLSLHEMDLSSLGFAFDGKQYSCPPPSQAKGHALRLVREIIRLVESASIEEWGVFSGVSPRSLRPFLSQRQRLVQEVRAGILPPLPGKRTEPFWNSVLSALVDRHRLFIDRQTSGDIYKLIRVPDTIHGSTGLLAKTISLDSLPEFDPFAECVAFSWVSQRKVFVKACPTIRIGSETLDGLSEKEITVPGPLAAYLVGWGAATLR
jgi:DNA primase small subunit